MRRSFSDKLKIYRMLPSWYRAYMLRLNLSWKFPALRAWDERRLARRWNRSSKDPEPTEQYLKNCFITAVPHPTVGVGHTLTEYNAGRVFAEALGATYVHCPLPEPWDAMLHFSEPCLSLPEVLSDRDFRVIRLPKVNGQLDDDQIRDLRHNMLSHAERGKVLFILGDGQNVFDHTRSADSLRACYWPGVEKEFEGGHPAVGEWNRSVHVGPLTSPRFFSPSAHNSAEFDSQIEHAFPLRDLRKSGKVNVAVHVRCPNKADRLVESMRQGERSDGFRRYLEIEYFVDVCKAVESAVGAEAVQFNVFAQGAVEDFAEFKALKNVNWCLDSDPYEAFYNLTLADVLVTSPSAFSYQAGLLCRGLKIANHPWWQEIPDGPEWLRVDSAEAMDIDVLRSKCFRRSIES